MRQAEAQTLSKPLCTLLIRLDGAESYASSLSFHRMTFRRKRFRHMAARQPLGSHSAMANGLRDAVFTVRIRKNCSSSGVWFDARSRLAEQQTIKTLGEIKANLN